MITQRTVRRLALAAGVALLGVAPAAADFRMEKSFALQPGGSFVLDSDVGSVEIVGSSGGAARMVVTSGRDDIESKFDFHVEDGADQVTVRVDKRSSLRSWLGWSGNLHFEIEVPAATRLNIETAGGSIVVEGIDDEVRLDTSGGSITASHIRGPVNADTSGGRIEIEDVDGNVDADTSGGGIRVEGVRGAVRADTSGGSIAIERVTGEVNADTSGGSIRLEEIGGRVEADTSGGSITASFAAGNGAGGVLSTSGGGVSVEVDPGVGLDIDASASGGSVVSDVPLTVRGEVSKTSIRGTLGGGGALLKLRASGGKIRIEAR